MTELADQPLEHAAAARLEDALGSPFDPASTMSFAAAVQSDEAELPPQASFDAMRSLGMWEYLVPVGLGGQLRSFEELLHVVRALARRDPVVPVGLGSTLLAAMPVWLWGSDEQRQAVAGHVLGARFGSLCVSEDDAGSDLVSTATRATQTPAGYVLDGEKWLVGNASRAAFAVTLARAQPGLGLFLLEPPEARAGSLRSLPKIRTLGLRAHDLSGMAFDGCRVGPGAPVGTVGRGLEMIAGALQFTRTMISGLALGATDTALRVATRWARRRSLYGAPMSELPPIRRLLAGAFADLVAADCTATAGVRGLNLALPRMALWSASAKYSVPWLCEGAMRSCAEVLSARHYLRERVAHGVFQKMLRDVAIASIFEGTQLVQLETVRAQLLHGARRGAAAADMAFSRHALFDFGTRVEAWDPDRRPALSFGGRDEIFDELEGAVEELLALALPDRGEVELQARRLLGLRDELRRDVADMARGKPGRSVAGYELARRYCLLNAAACCVNAWAAKGADLDSAVLVVALERLLERLGEPCVRELFGFEDRCMTVLAELEEESRLFSILPSTIASEGGL